MFLIIRTTWTRAIRALKSPDAAFLSEYPSTPYFLANVTGNLVTRKMGETIFNQTSSPYGIRLDV